MIAELPAEMECRRPGRVDENAITDIQDCLEADVLETTGPFELHDEKKVFVGVSANVIPISMDAIEIIGNMGELHTADIDTPGCPRYGLAALHCFRIEVAADRLEITGPLIIGNGCPCVLHQGLIVQELQLCLPTVSVNDMSVSRDSPTSAKRRQHLRPVN